MKTLLVFCAIICLASSAEYFQIRILDGRSLGANAEFNKIFGEGSWYYYWKKEKEHIIDGIKFVTMKNQGAFGNGGKVLDIKGNCEGKHIHLWEEHAGYQEYQMFAFIKNGTVLSACKNSKGQFQMIVDSPTGLIKVEPDANIPDSRRLIGLLPYYY